MKTRIVVLSVVLFTISLAAQQTGQRGNMGARRMQPPKAVTHNGHPALEFDAPAGSIFIEYFTYQGEPALGVPFAQGQCFGHVYVTRTRIAGDFRNTACSSFDVPREGAAVERQGGAISLMAGGASYSLTPLVERGGQQRPAERAQLPAEIFARAVKAFGRAYASVRRMGLEAGGGQPNAAQPSLAQAAAKARASRQGTLTITSEPGDSQVYVNDEPRGMTSAEGREVLPLQPGNYKVRVSLPGYQDFQQSVTVASGQNQDVSANLAPVGPPPFKAADVEEMLKGAMSPKRIATLVQERGVDFAVTPELEKQLRAMGATSDLLQALSANKK